MAAQTSASVASLPSTPKTGARLPYKHLGYPELSRYIASDNDSFLFRRFGALNARVLLNLQHDIEVQEKYLSELDEAVAQDPHQFALLNSLAWDKHPNNPHPQRAIVLEKLQPLLHRYNEHLVTYSCLRDKKSAQEYQAANVRNWLANWSNPNAKQSGPIRDEEQQYLGSEADLICIATQHKHPVATLLERWSFIRKLFRKRRKHGQLVDEKTIIFSGAKIEWLANALVVMLGLVMLYGPMWWLNYVFDDAKRLAIITVFVFLFTVALSLIGSGRPFETLAAAAAYAAVLMVFMQRQSADSK